MLPATAAELLNLQPIRHCLPILGSRIISFFAFTALQRNDLSGHCSLTSSLKPLAGQPGNLSTKYIPSEPKLRDRRLLDLLESRYRCHRCPRPSPRETAILLNSKPQAAGLLGHLRSAKGMLPVR